jgi:hypothetical protein
MFDLNKKEKPFTSFGGFGGGGLGLAGGAISAKTYVDDVFSTFLYYGTSGNQIIPNGIDLDGEGGLIWIKARDAGRSHSLTDTVTGIDKNLICNNQNQQATDADRIIAKSANGFTLYGDGTNVNYANEKYVSWTFRKAPGFFDVVTYNGDTSNNPQSIPHSLGSVPGFIIVKRTDGTGPWLCYHRSLGNTKNLELQGDNDEDINSAIWNNTDPTSTHFTVGSNANVNGNGRTFVAYIFAHDDAQYGTGGNESIVKCGTYTGGGTTNVEVNLGFEPQFVLIRCSTRPGGYAGGWYLFDSIRGIYSGSTDPTVQTQETNEEASSTNAMIELTPTGFKTDGEGLGANADGGTYIYMAIRRPNKPPEAAINVFAIDTSEGTSPTPPQFTSGFVTDFIIRKTFNAANNTFGNRLSGTKYMSSYSTSAESSATLLTWDFMNGWSNSVSDPPNTNLGCYMFKRAHGFMDVVTYEGTGTNSAGTQQVVNHNLGKTPELVIVKNRDSAKSFFVWSIYMTEQYRMRLDDTAQELSGGQTYWQANSTFTTTQFGLGYGVNTNKDGDKHVAYLFASLAGISKVGTYPGDTGVNVDVDCGFSADARFVLIKRKDAEVTGTNSSGWYVWDSVRGIGNGNDPYWLTNSTDNPVTNTNYVDSHPENKGFRVNSSAPAALNVTGGTYLFLAIA